MTRLRTRWSAARQEALPPADPQPRGRTGSRRLPAPLALLMIPLALSPSPGCSSGAPGRAPAARSVGSAADVADAVARVFAGAAKPESPAGGRWFAADFNADGVEDLAVVVRPDPARIGEINHELANWILEDPRPPEAAAPDAASLAHTTAAMPASHAPSRPRTAPGEELIAIIHGYGPAAWRSPDARQTFVLTRAIGSQMGTAPVATIVRNFPADLAPRDVLTETLDGHPGYLYWTGARYAWRDRP
ncbi:MAG: hypothetical protein HY049_17170 [Acidobacteria bacterium]|nr:hypothetical protein [Acidobacteriota bacterium]